MTYTPHTPVKPEFIAAAAAVALEQKLVVPAVFQREGIDQYKGKKDDTINVRVEGVLPFRTYGWRNNRSAAIQFDQYAERTVAVTFGGDIYSGVELTDEQRDFDMAGWTKLVSKQVEAVGRGLEYQAVDYLTDAEYNVTLGGAVSGRNLRATLVKAREVMNKLRLPKEGRVLLVGSGWESALLNDEKMNLAQNVGDDEAVSALREATLGRRFGFSIVTSNELPSDMAVAMIGSAFIFATGAPSVPASIAKGATASHNGVAVRWLQDYDMTHTTDRSLVNTYKGFRRVDDILLGRDETSGQAFVSEHEHFVRAIKLDLDATADVTPEGEEAGDAADEFALITGIGTPYSA